MKNQIIFVLIFVSIPFLAKTQTGPGGIEDTTGSSPLLLWLKADFGIQVSDNDSVDVWNDQSGYQHDADSLRSDARPVYLLDRVNGNPAVQFNGGNDQRLSIPHSSSLDHNGDYTLFMLISPENSSEQFPFFLSKFLSEINSQYHLGFESTFKLQSWFGVPTMASDAAVSNQTFSFLPGSYSLVTSQVTFSNPTSALSYFINGTLDNTKLINGQTPINTQPLFIGGGVQGASERDVTGDIAEVIIISRSIAEVERVLVENYLEAKYGGQGVENLFDISNDIFQQPGAQSYNRFMAGIGRLSGVEHRESHSGGIRIRDRDYLSEDGDFLTFSYDSETNFLSTEDLPAEVVNRWHRDWYLDIRDISANGGEIELKFDFSEAGLSLNSDEFVLLSRSNTGIDFEILAHSASLSDDQVTFILDVNDLNSQAYYTLGTYQKKAGPGNAFTLDGTNYIDSEYQSTLPTKFSISAWFKLDDLSANQTLIGKGVDDTNEELLLAFLSDGSIFFDTRDFRQQSFANEVETGKWYHIFVSKNGSILNCWLNGRLISWRTGELQSTPSDESQPVLIGNGRNSSLSFEGQIDEVVLWNGDIDDEDIIRSWICKKIDGLHPDYNRILLYYRFDELVQSKALDFSRNANNARLLNTPQMDTSGAALGDESIYDYVAPLDTFLLAAENDSVLVSNITGSPDGVHLYYVNTTPFDTTSNLDLLDVDKYWGVFVAGGSNPTFDLIYNYTGNRQAGDENQNRLARRDDHSQSWQNSGSVPQKLSNRLQLNDNERGEYILGFDRASSSGDGPGAANSLQYDGQDDFTNLGNSLNPGSGDFSWEVWLKVDDFGDESSQQVFSQGLSGTGIPANAGFGLELEDDIANDEFAARFLIRGNGNSLFASTASGLKEGEWYHLAGVRSANNVRIYVNGILRNVAITPSTYDVSSNLDFGMGSFLEAGNESKFFKGKIDEFRFWNQALNVDEIREWLCRKVNPQHPQYQFLIAYHRFDLNSGTFSPDRAGVSNGTLSSTLSSPAQWDISGAALGDSAQVNYSSPTSLTYSSAKSSLSLSNITGGAQGVIIYQSPALPQGSTLPSPITEIDDEFYGVFSSGDITYDVVYDYSDNFSVLSPPTLALPRSLIQLGVSAFSR